MIDLDINRSQDKASNDKFGNTLLGMHSHTRRDFLGATLLASGAQLLHPFSPTQLLAQQPDGIILNRWGHAYLSPQPGFFFGTNGNPAPREVLRSAAFGRIAFANTDLAGAMDHRCSILEARSAVSQVFDSVLD